MTYLDRINSFWDYATTNPLSTGQVSLYLALLHVCNKSYWTEWFQAPNQVLSVLTGLSRSGILKARNELKQRGLIDFKERGTRATIYKLTIANSMQESTQDNTIANSAQNSMQESTIANSTQDCTQNSKQDSTQDSKQESVQESTIANSTQNSKQDRAQAIANSTQDSTQAIYSIYNNIYNKDKRQKTEDKRQPPISPVEHFADFWLAYPHKCRQALTEKAYCDVLLSGTASEEELVKSAQNYAEYIRLTGEKMYYPNNFLEKYVFQDFLPGTYQKPDKAKHRFSFAPENLSVPAVPENLFVPENQAAEPAGMVEQAAEEELAGDDWMNYGPGWSERNV